MIYLPFILAPNIITKVFMGVAILSSLQVLGFSYYPKTFIGLLWIHSVLCMSNFCFWKSKHISFPHSSVSKESACNAGDPGLIPASGRSPVEGNDNRLQYSCLENPMDSGIWCATVHRVAKRQMQLNHHKHIRDFSLHQRATGIQSLHFPALLEMSGIINSE